MGVPDDSDPNEMSGTPNLVPGVLVGHVTDSVGATGCTVILLPEGTVASGEIRGGAPATRDFGLLAPEKLVECVDAVVLSGGSTFGLAAVDGVVEALAEQQRGFATAHGPVPIVVGMALYDLGVGSPAARPTAADGAAAMAALTERPATGRVGAGAGALVGKWRGIERASPGGLGIATVGFDDVLVTAIVAVNAAGDVGNTTTLDALAAGTFDDWGTRQAPFTEPGTNTTIGLVVANIKATPTQCLLMAQSGHDAYARSFVPPHTRSDGDAIVAAATGEVEASIDEVRLLTIAAVEQAIKSAVVGTINE